MSKFLTPPVWYDKNGNLNEMLTGNAVTSSDIAIGSGTRANGDGVAIKGSTVGGGAAINGAVTLGGAAINGTATDGGVAINGTAAGGGVAIGSKTLAIRGGIAIGAEASANNNQIQLGKNDTAYTLNVGNGTGTINGVRLSVSDAVIQLGQDDTAYTLNVGNGNGVTSGYIEKGISSLDNDPKHGFVDVSYSQGGNYVKKDVSGGIYVVRVKNNTVGNKTLCTFLFEIDGKETEDSSLFEYDGGTEFKYAVIKATPDNTGRATLSVVDSVEYGAGPIREYTNFTISVRRISDGYAVG